MLIPRRVRKFLAGNWGKPTKEEKKVNLPNPLYPESPKHFPKKKHSKDKRLYDFYSCPFCHTELPITKRQEFLMDERATTCPHCQSYKVTECPACKHTTWFNPETRIFKHQFIGCGFEGKKRETS